VVVVGVADVVRAEVLVPRLHRAAEQAAVPQVADRVADHLRRPPDRGRDLHGRRSLPRQPVRTRSVSPPASSTRRASREPPRIGAGTALIRSPRNVGAKTTSSRSRWLSLESCCLYAASPCPKSTTSSAGSAIASSIARSSR